ncbi:MAG: hypothetical protein UW32_C0001G0146 [Candidatus Wolfebacteria bacterium GW2011_GWE2_44_13]|uniref:Uncharacterized protein n=1 Tax=Candidatus Wolfebacteria bacterium GW2011_GWE2_44_13 TaxID=1619017 RepID=A0A0G1K6S1_9BACT|nr:MAG: hypothetical protein UW32_C0001G0146 [Candidatus Wolfebacteria bacterium GW2011_GWE2_44_13]
MRAGFSSVKKIEISGHVLFSRKKYRGRIRNGVIESDSLARCTLVYSLATPKAKSRTENISGSLPKRLKLGTRTPRVGVLKHRASSDIFPAPLIRNILMFVSRITRIGVLFYSLANEGVGFFN